MKKKLLLLLFAFLTFNSYAQINFEKGYFIENNGNKVDCLIKNLDWQNNPTEFQYKLDDQDQPINVTINQVKEFGIDNISKYERYDINIDLSKEDISNLTYEKAPDFKQKVIFLKVLVEGKATLYQYEESNLTRYFFKTESLPTNQLVHKVYKISEGEIAHNTQFRQQLWMNLKCDNINTQKIQKVDYKKGDLVNFFIKYNQCNSSDFTNFEKKEKKDLFNLNIRPGLKSSSFDISNSEVNELNCNFDAKIGFRLGLEAEFILPFNKNKWALIVEPTYQNFKSEKTQNNRFYAIDYSSIEIPFGVRHYFFLNDDSKIFINGQCLINLNLGSKLSYQHNTKIDYLTEIDLHPKPTFAFGMGYNFKKKYSAELRMNIDQNILGNYLYWSSHYKTISVIFGYSIF